MPKNSAADNSLHLTDLRGGATLQFRKAWERNALRSVAWEDLHRDPNPFNAAAYLMQTLEPYYEASGRSLSL